MTDWVLTILASLASGAVGSILATYATQTRERRQARVQVRDAIRQVQELSYKVPTYGQLAAALDDLETSAMLAGLPRMLVSLNREALTINRSLIERVAEGGSPQGSAFTGSGVDIRFAVDHISGETLQLLIGATWHPILAAPYRWWRTRQLTRVMNIRPRTGPRPRDKRRWERKTIRIAKQERKARRQAQRSKG
jgi:hypothetical protein